MTNWEKYKDEILKINLINGFAKVGGEITYCNNTDCDDCQFSNKGNCDREKFKWLDEEYKEPSPYSDWEIDDKIEVSHDTINWEKGHFAGTNADGRPMCWHLGGTSWSRGNRNMHKIPWNYARKVEE